MPRAGPLHDSPDADSVRAIAVGDHANSGVDRSLDFVERADLFPAARRSHHDAMIANLVVVVGVRRLPQLEHDVVRRIDHVADARYSAGFEPVAQPRWRRSDLHAANHARGEAPTQSGRLNLDANRVADL